MPYDDREAAFNGESDYPSHGHDAQHLPPRILQCSHHDDKWRKGERWRQNTGSSERRTRMVLDFALNVLDRAVGKGLIEPLFPALTTGEIGEKTSNDRPRSGHRHIVSHAVVTARSQSDHQQVITQRHEKKRRIQDSQEQQSETTQMGEESREFPENAVHAELAALWLPILGAHPFFGEETPVLTRSRASRGSPGNGYKRSRRRSREAVASQSAEDFHNSSAERRDRTNGVSLTSATRPPHNRPNQTRNESASITATNTNRMPQIAASIRAFKINVRVAGALAAATLPPCNALSSLDAWARNPIAGTGEKIFCHAAVNVTATSQHIGNPVIHTNFVPCILIRMVVATQSATVASNWLEMPNNGHSELIPPSGSSTPCTRK